MAFLTFLLVLLASVASRAASIGSNKDIIPNSYIVTFKRGVVSSDIDSHFALLNNIHARSLERHPPLAGLERRYNISTFQGYAGAFSDETIAEIRASPLIAHVEHDRLMYMADLETQTDAPSWGLGAISHRGGAESRDYIFDNSPKYDTFAYVIDSGINEAHDDFSGRASLEWNAYDSERDGVGHGTHVAGNIGGRRYGVAKNTKIFVAKAFDDDGRTTAAICLDAYDWATNDILGHNDNRESRAQASAINLSFGSYFPVQGWNEAVGAAFGAGIVTVVAARNDGVNASRISPGSAPMAFTVGATTKDNAWAPYSNFGSAVNILAPGSKLESAGTGSSTAEEVKSGTSMSTAYVTGLMLYLMSLHKYETPADVINSLMGQSTNKLISDVPDETTDLFAYNGNGA